MESKDSLYRQAMIYMRRFKGKNAKPEVCLNCIGWKHFGGQGAEDVTMGPMCVCDGNWVVVNNIILAMKTKKLLIV